MPLNLKNKPLYWIGGGVIILVAATLLIWFFASRQSGLERASSLYQQGNISAASNEYGKVLNRFGGGAESWSNYGNTLRDLKKYDEAVSAYRQAISADPGYHAAYRNLSYVSVDMEELSGQKGKIDEAIALVEDGFKKTGSKSFYLAEDLIMLYGRKGDSAKVKSWTETRERLLAEG